MHRLRGFLLVAISVFFLCPLLLAGTVHATVVTSSDFTSAVGTSSKTFADGTKFTSSPSPFILKTVDGWTGLGVREGYEYQEIDSRNSEKITIDFSGLEFNAAIVNSLTLAFLFPDGVYSDAVNEKALITFTNNNGAKTTYELMATGTTAVDYVWTGEGTVTNLSLPVEPHAGVWQIDNPYGEYTTMIELTSFDYGIADKTNGDYSFVAVDYTPVPEPGTMMLLGSGLVGLAGWGRKKFRN